MRISTTGSINISRNSTPLLPSTTAGSHSRHFSSPRTPTPHAASVVSMNSPGSSQSGPFGPPTAASSLIARASLARTAGSMGGTTGTSIYPAPRSLLQAPPVPTTLLMRSVSTADLGQAVMFLMNSMVTLSNFTVAWENYCPTKSMGWQRDSTTVRHFLAAFSNWVYAQKDQMNVELSNGQWHC